MIFFVGVICRQEQQGIVGEDMFNSFPVFSFVIFTIIAIIFLYTHEQKSRLTEFRYFDLERK
jgi:hypothetical protein